MKKLCFVDFVGGFLEFVPLFSRIGAQMAVSLFSPAGRRWRVSAG
jgi:hypothetical protein